MPQPKGFLVESLRVSQIMINKKRMNGYLVVGVKNDVKIYEGDDLHLGRSK